MQDKIKPLLTELIWLACSFMLTILLATFIYGWPLFSERLHLHDTYFEISPWFILTPLFLFVFFVLYFIKQKRKSFSNTFQNWLVIFSGVVLIALLTFLTQIFSQIISEYTLYSPLSGLGNSINPEITTNPVAKVIIIFLTIVQLIVVTILLYFTYFWGVQKNIKQKE